MRRYYAVHEGIAQLLEVLALVRDARPSTPWAVTEARRRAVVEVARRRDRDPTTVSNKYRRCLGIAGTDPFDTLVTRWLLQGSTELQSAMEIAYHDSNHHAIREFFGAGR